MAIGNGNYLANPDEKTVRALAHLRTSPEFAVVCRWLGANLETVRDDLIDLTEREDIYRAQGASAVLREFLKLNGDAPEALKRFAGQQ